MPSAAVISGLRGEKAGVRNQIAGFEIIGAVEHQIVAADQRHRIAGIQPRGVRGKPDMGIERMNLLGGAVDLAAGRYRAWRE